MSGVRYLTWPHHHRQSLSGWYFGRSPLLRWHHCFYIYKIPPGHQCDRWSIFSRTTPWRNRLVTATIPAPNIELAHVVNSESTGDLNSRSLGNGMSWITYIVSIRRRWTKLNNTRSSTPSSCQLCRIPSPLTMDLLIISVTSSWAASRWLDSSRSRNVALLYFRVLVGYRAKLNSPLVLRNTAYDQCFQPTELIFTTTRCNIQSNLSPPNHHNPKSKSTTDPKSNTDQRNTSNPAK
jgi:hypothetical protein